MDKYDYLITGAGAAGLSLLMHLIDSGRFEEKRILLVDRAPKNSNDRTWCFWEQKAGLFDPVIYKKWDTLWFHDKTNSSLHDISPYQYKLIRGIDFYNYCLEIIARHNNIEILYQQVEQCVSDAGGTYAVVGEKKIFARYIFNSILFEKPVLSANQHYLLQHFKGWIIETPMPAFDEARATLMDFRISQINGNTSFVYVMPFSANRALVEFTMFSKEQLKEHEYDEALKNYCRQYLHLSAYTVTDQEFGIIPMTDYRFEKRRHNIISIGTAGGQTKASSGYTFHFIQQHSRAIVQALLETGKPFVREPVTDKRFNLYDRTLLRILALRAFSGEKVFSILMNSNKMSEVFKFLNNDTSFAEELRIIRKLPKGIFLRSALGLLRNRKKQESLFKP